MKRRYLKFLILISFLLLFINILPNKAYAESYLADKTEIPVELEVSGAEALCQTSDGFVWIAQYSGLTRYDSKEYVTYKSFTENGITYDIINVRKLINNGNDLYILTKEDVFKYSNNSFSHINIGDDFQELLDFAFDDENRLLYICSDNGLIIYNIDLSKAEVVENTIGQKISDVVIDKKRNRYYYLLFDGAYNNNHEKVFDNSLILEAYIYDDTMLFCLVNGIIRYNLATNSLYDTQYDMVTDHVNIALYSEKDKMLFVGCDNVGIVCISENGEYQTASNLLNKKEIVDLMIDYEGNLWFASHDTSSSGVSFITKNALLNLLYDDEIWQSDIYKNASKTVYAMKKHDDILYVCLGKTGLLLFDLKQNKIIPSTGDNIVIEKLKEYHNENGLSFKVDIRDVEEYNGKLYFADYGVGLVEFDPSNNELKVYDLNYFNDKSNILNIIDSTKTHLTGDLLNLRCLRSFNGFLVCGYQSGGVYKFKDGKISVVHTDKSTLFINKDESNNVLFNNTSGVYRVANDFNSFEEIEKIEGVSGNVLKFLAADNRYYYNLNGRFFYAEYKDGKYINKEIIIPYIKGSIVEISKVKIKKLDGNIEYKYVISSLTQIYIIDSLDDSNIDSQGKIIKYEIFDDTNGLKNIQSNTSGFYDEDNSKYYFQTTEGIFVYDFNNEEIETIPVKIKINSTNIDGNPVYGNEIKLNQNVNRLAFNVSVFGFKPNNGYSIYYKLDGVDAEYNLLSSETQTISYTNLAGGKYQFHVYAVDSLGQQSNHVDITVEKDKKVTETVWFWVLMVVIGLVLIGILNLIIILNRTRKAKRKEAELKAITIESIEAIARTIDAKDTYTNGHSIRVGYFSRIIAKELGMQGEELDNLYYIALLHDIGKIGIPDAILNKPGRLTDEEFAIMKSHTTKGAKILADISTIPNIVEGAKYHHERYGGGGYPEGLKGEDIPFVARIICCADCYDAMATKRVYKEPYSKEKIIDEFEKCKNTQFDPKIADVVIELIKNNKLRDGFELKSENKDKAEG